MCEIPDAPAVWVCDKIFFVNKLLQDCSGMYFIPERFFLGIISFGCAIGGQ